MMGGEKRNALVQNSRTIGIRLAQNQASTALALKKQCSVVPEVGKTPLEGRPDRQKF
jgi:hypothetical protein